MIFRRSREPQESKPRRPARRDDHAASNHEDLVGLLPVAAIVLDPSLRPLTINDSARQLLGLHRSRLPARLPTPEVTEVAREAAGVGSSARRVAVWYPSRSVLEVRATSLGQDQGVLVIVQDVTEEERAQQARKDLVAHASHELKSPVASLQALAEAVASSVREDPGTAERFAGMIVEETTRLGNLLNDLLDLSRLEEAQGTAPTSTCDLAEVTRQEATKLSGFAERSDVSLSVEATGNTHVTGDEQQLGIMVRNLLDNGIRYTPAGGTVSTTIEQRDGGVALVVRDTGAGIPQDAQARVFERFYRVDRARTRAQGGTGLGLAIVKHAVELHRGTLQLESELGHGSTFTVVLPGAPSDPAPERLENG